MAWHRCGGGGNKTAIVEFDWHKDERNKHISLGFRPKYICLYTTASESIPNPIIAIYNKDVGEVIVRQYGEHVSSRLNLPTDGGATIATVDDDGFTLGYHTYSTNNGIEHCYVFAIG